MVDQHDSDAAGERCAGCRRRDGQVGAMVQSAAAYLELFAGSGGGPDGAGVEEVRSAWLAGDFEAAVAAWGTWLMPQLQELARQRRAAEVWETELLGVIRLVAGRLAEAGGAGTGWADGVSRMWAQLAAVWDSHDEFRVPAAARHWMGFALRGLIEGVMEREWQAMVGALPPAVRPLAGEVPPQRQAELAAGMFELAEWHHRAYGIDGFDLFGDR